MKIGDIRQKTATELQDELNNLRREQMNLRFRQASGDLKNTGRVQTIRRAIAKVKTVMTERRQKADVKSEAK